MSSANPEVDHGWRLVSIGVEGDPVDLDGVNPWSVNWTSTGRTVTVSHPNYSWERHTMRVYEIATGERVVIFAAAEFSAGVWGFYVATDAADH